MKKIIILLVITSVMISCKETKPASTTTTTSEVARGKIYEADLLKKIDSTVNNQKTVVDYIPLNFAISNDIEISLKQFIIRNGKKTAAEDYEYVFYDTNKRRYKFNLSGLSSIEVKTANAESFTLYGDDELIVVETTKKIANQINTGLSEFITKAIK